jgi:hypothetical protein
MKGFTRPIPEEQVLHQAFAELIKHLFSKSIPILRRALAILGLEPSTKIDHNASFHLDAHCFKQKIIPDF